MLTVSHYLKRFFCSFLACKRLVVLINVSDLDAIDFDNDVSDFESGFMRR